MRLLYFARIRAQVGSAGEELKKPPHMITVSDLIHALKARGGSFGTALRDPAAVKVAVNRDYVGVDHLLNDDDEVAIFPPVTGG